MAPAGGDFDGNDFASNLFSDLAPLLALFGEQVTKQFLSMSLGWPDNVLLTMGPLGILTIVVSAIRVAGDEVPNLKALIGRAREDKASAEVELLSSTSNEVCREIFDAGNNSAYEWHKIRESLKKYPSNLTLNVSGATTPKHKMWQWAGLGILFQLASLALSGIIAYKRNWAQVDNPASTYGYPCYFVGTMLLTLGVMRCGHVVEMVSEEYTLRCKPEMREKITLFRIQLAAIVSDQHFDTYSLLNARHNPDLHISTYKRHRDAG
ncbi:hypothetical protein B0T21DRAFT_387446 [Apiosordaria backusii]|uniref:Uncharacterized protein n=1 Tax=Apiosordaria backusii TaxID=314023 RepID=A0AA40DP91_9PEZI|nr:hypothetical protein B0T21DRAFT_387446 [Apiosordaria backusii]